MTTLDVYGVAQSRTARVLWMVRELGLEFQHHDIGFRTGETTTPEFLAINPNARIPAIVDGDLKLWESMAINLYLARKHGGPLQPATLEDEARATQWSFWVMTEVEKPLLAMLFNRAILPEDQRQADVADRSEEDLQRPLKVLDGEVSKRPYLLGQDFTVADLNVASVLTWAKVAKLDLSSYPAIADWLDRCTARPAAK